MEELEITKLTINKEDLYFTGNIIYHCVVNSEMHFRTISNESLMTGRKHLTENEFIDMAKDAYINQFKKKSK